MVFAAEIKQDIVQLQEQVQEHTQGVSVDVNHMAWAFGVSVTGCCLTLLAALLVARYNRPLRQREPLSVGASFGSSPAGLPASHGGAGGGGPAVAAAAGVVTSGAVAATVVVAQPVMTHGGCMVTQPVMTHGGPMVAQPVMTHGGPMVTQPVMTHGGPMVAQPVMTHGGGSLAVCPPVGSVASPPQLYFIHPQQLAGGFCPPPYEGRRVAGTEDVLGATRTDGSGPEVCLDDLSLATKE